MTQDAVQVVWFKRDLRVRDHAPLVEAARRGPVLALYVYEPSWMTAPDFDPSHLEFIGASLAKLREGLRKRGGELVIRLGEMPDVLEELRRMVGFRALWSHEETGNAISYARDLRVKAWAQASGVVWHELPQNGVVRGLRDRDGWSQQWTRRMEAPILPAPERLTPVVGVDPQGVRGPEDVGLGPSERTDAMVGGELEAWRTLETFLWERGVNYRADMSSPVEGWWGCSRLSPYLAWGNLSMRHVFQRTQARQRELEVMKRAGEPLDRRWLSSLRSFQSRLRWHGHFMQKLEQEPALEFENMNRGFDGMREGQFDEARFEAWVAGQTGYPMVDACMRALRATGWLNFRMRAMVVSFASYHLWLHWRRPAHVLARLFLDYEPGIHFSQVQMQSGVTGINTIRIYAPAKQVADQDPHGVFIRRWVPELEAVPDTWIAEPHTMPPLLQLQLGCVIGRDYPAPIVDHVTAYRHARETVHAWKRRPEVRALSEEVLARHGSRKRRGGGQRSRRQKASRRPKPDMPSQDEQGRLF